MTVNPNLKLTFLIFITFCSACLGQGNSKFRVVLDAGHGGKDFGANYHGFVEKNIVLNVSNKVGKILEKEQDIEVVYTRKTDVFIELNERANIANNANASVFVSIHCNGAANQSAYGTETFVMGLTRNASNLEVAKKENAVVTMEEDYKIKYKDYDPNKPESLIGLQMMQEEYLDQSIDIASKVQDAFTYELKRKSRGVKQAGFLVLRNIYMPRILIELGFISHRPEGQFLNSEAGQDKLAKAIAEAILNYKKEFHIPIIQKTAQPAPVKEHKPETEVITVVPVKEEVKESVAEGVIFKVQISASARNLDTVPSNFNGLTSISKDSSTSLIKYFYGETRSYEEANELKQQARDKGFESAFVVAFRNGKKIPVQEALKKH
ncbi:N-acetylmuramoyl-L-alanine amidase [Flavobacterium salilacus subsp. salilacus]|uniref:N-acetylmuramoyl-L-alanine amidase family protein n=1 Tax=Flavobacterium TaxID=237 RepID=UPI001075827F|nr:MULTISPECIES: N-acetylmuramoyl-L-alanine amidase [Flavobacterium]KAF2519242.1 N-acetylmuramoyl-L-alanine amidase [Flavobacterium salilacus subsp. salilacus]MBE1613425.1 N-acetylmuramoyl-L-alanine amidase [Flavobacterium sp. SaA2.13]NDI98840.1 N-acetylmuramoyl-L-alanine amidase [Flavobacterium salilacus subsp. altitudinum]